MSSVCGDGALTIGGPDHRHSSPQAAEFLWRSVHAELQGKVPDMTTWDAFHRADVAAWRAFKKVPLAMAVFDTARQLDHLFGVDEGVLLYRGVAAAMTTKATYVRAQGDEEGRLLGRHPGQRSAELQGNRQQHARAT